MLDISEFDLPNTRERSAGFAEGIKSRARRIRWSFIPSTAAGCTSKPIKSPSDALRLNPKTNVIFGINDDSVLAGIQAYFDLNLPPDNLIAVNVGGEGATSLKALSENTPLVASAALFPEIVGKLAVDAVVHLWSGGQMDGAIITPYALLTKANLREYYRETENGWELSPDHDGRDARNGRSSFRPTSRTKRLPSSFCTRRTNGIRTSPGRCSAAPPISALPSQSKTLRTTCRSRSRNCGG